MASSYLRKIIFTTLGFSSSVLLNFNTSSFVQAITLPSLSTTTNSSTYTPPVQQKKSNSQWVYRVAERVIRANGLDDYPWRFQITNEYNFNAYAGELNKIIIYQGLLDQIHGDDAALAFIISHELAHHTHRHSAQQEEAETSLKEKLLKEAEAEYNNWIVQERRKSQKPISTATKDVIKQRIILQKKQEFDRTMLALNRQHEFQADEIGYIYMIKAGYDINGGLRVFNLFSRFPSDYTENSSHPPTQQRINTLKQVMNKYLWFPLWTDGNERLKNNPQPLKLDLSEDGVSLRINSRFISR
ncbi:M48 family metalloprotease [Scytonema sp. UIC 10036]|uniref:M48 family metallopeptidase n=1 Tax=Scytonema sp. UIC 10036 TaxID=2304196 RepID=UPI0012DA5156|nr:M48 family metallopeptidase [Scytonema sp. UIC 10036]MUG94106.1 M48 family metalloprotease [Scytonema sp. UIC 10036]